MVEEQQEDAYAHIVQASPTCQARKVYNWEDRQFPEASGSCYLSIKECQEHVNQVWTDLGMLNPPRVSDGRGGTSARSWGDRIMLPRWSRNFTVLNHELAHCITELIDSHDNHDHGAIFMHIYVTLMARYGMHNHTELRKSATDFGVIVGRVKLRSRLKPYTATLEDK